MRTLLSKNPHSVGKIGFFPLTTVQTMSNGPFWYQLTYSPETSQQTAMRCDVYSSIASKAHELEDAAKISLTNELKQNIREFEKQHKQLTTSGYHSTGANGVYSRLTLKISTLTIPRFTCQHSSHGRRASWAGENQRL